MNTFRELGISDTLIKKLTEQYITVPTAIQNVAIPMVINQEDFVAAIQKALAEKDEEKKEQRWLSVEDETWNNKVSIIKGPIILTNY